MRHRQTQGGVVMQKTKEGVTKGARVNGWCIVEGPKRGEVTDVVRVDDVSTSEDEAIMIFHYLTTTESYAMMRVGNLTSDEGNGIMRGH